MLGQSWTLVQAALCHDRAAGYEPPAGPAWLRAPAEPQLPPEPSAAFQAGPAAALQGPGATGSHSPADSAEPLAPGHESGHYHCPAGRGPAGHRLAGPRRRQAVGSVQL